jgi:hypothetical protein
MRAKARAIMRAKLRGPTLSLLLTAALLAQTSKPQPLSIGRDSVGETLAVYIAHDPDCFKEPHLQMSTVGNQTVAGCDIETRKGEILKLAGVQITKRHVVMDQERIVSLGYEFKHHDYAAMRAAFIKELGQPQGVKTDSDDKGCAGERAAWKNEVSVVNLQECFAASGSSIAVFGLLDFAARPTTPDPKTTEPKTPPQ